MASEMVERAEDMITRAREAWLASLVVADANDAAAMVVSAALDLSNDKHAFQVLVTALAVADDGHPDGLKYRDQAKAVLSAFHDHIAALKSHAQGKLGHE